MLLYVLQQKLKYNSYNRLIKFDKNINVTPKSHNVTEFLY